MMIRTLGRVGLAVASLAALGGCASMDTPSRYAYYEVRCIHTPKAAA